jgi:hypothetical protein
MTNKILYIGSGMSATQALEPQYDDCIKVAVNNAWRLFENNRFDVWIHSGDFPRERFPKIKNYDSEIAYSQYSKSAEAAMKRFGWVSKSPQHYAGYTIFFMGLYYILMEMNPDKIGLLGFDHDYNSAKTEKWNNDNRPNIQNRFNDKTESTIEEWSNNYFGNMEKDFFYGHGTPDPLRLGKKHLLEKFEIVKNSAKTLGVEIVNCSGVFSDINTFPHGEL